MAGEMRRKTKYKLESKEIRLKEKYRKKRRTMVNTYKTKMK